MKFRAEIYLTKKFVTKEEWLNFINVISNYNGILKKWKIRIEFERNIVRYFIETKCSLPSSINGLKSFIKKK